MTREEIGCSVNAWVDVLLLVNAEVTKSREMVFCVVGPEIFRGNKEAPVAGHLVYHVVYHSYTANEPMR